MNEPGSDAFRAELITILESDFDPHLQRVDDESLSIVSLNRKGDRLELCVSYRVLESRCCSAPNIEEVKSFKLKLRPSPKGWEEG